MLIIGESAIEHPTFGVLDPDFSLEDLLAISKDALDSKKCDFVCAHNFELIEGFAKQSFPFAVLSSGDLRIARYSFLLASNLCAKFCIAESIDIARELQKISDDYLLEIKVLLLVKSDEDMDNAIDARLDGIIQGSALVAL